MKKITTIKNVIINLILIIVVVSFVYGALYFFFVYAVKFKNNEKIAIIERLPQTKWVADIELCLSAHRLGPMEALPRLIRFDVKKVSDEALDKCLSEYPRSKRKLIRRLIKKYDPGKSR